VFLSACLSACTSPQADGPRILAGSDDLALIAPAHALTLSRVPVGARINEILAVPPDVYLATWEGLTHLASPFAEDAAPAVTDSLGTLDGLEWDGASGHLYLLHHPGFDPNEVTENHRVIEWDPRTRSAVREWTVDLLSYDLHLDPGRGVLITPLRGRRLWWVSFADDAARPIGMPPAPGRTPPARREDSVDGGASYLRIGATRPGGRGFVVVEQGLAERNRIWLVEPESGVIDGFDLSRSSQYQGGVLAPDGNTLVLNAIQAVEVIDLRARVERAWIPLDRPHFRIAIAPDGNVCWLTAPGVDPGSGHVTTVDLVAERVTGRTELVRRADAVAFWAP
jgi:hypothetical protein